MKDTSASLLRAAVAGILGATVIAAPAAAKGKMKGNMMEVVKCYGVNKCGGQGKCGGEGQSCAGQNSCKGKGWLFMPKDSCLAIENGSLEPLKMGDSGEKETMEDKGEKKTEGGK